MEEKIQAEEGISSPKQKLAQIRTKIQMTRPKEKTKMEMNYKKGAQLLIKSEKIGLPKLSLSRPKTLFCP